MIALFFLYNSVDLCFYYFWGFYLRVQGRVLFY